MHPHGWLQADTLSRYKAQLAQGARPTALALSVLHVKGPADWDQPPAVTEHWCLTHYLLDGHHKIYAASQAQSPITILSLLATSQGISSVEQLSEMRSALQAADA